MTVGVREGVAVERLGVGVRIGVVVDKLVANVVREAPDEPVLIQIKSIYYQLFLH